MDWSTFVKGVFILNVLGIVYNPETKQILIGKRENDPYLPELSWCFPGGKADYKDLEVSLLEHIKQKTNLDVDIKKSVFAKTYPEKREFASIYYLCEIAGLPAEASAKAGDKFTEVKWVKPTAVKEYFTTSIHPDLFEYLKTLE